MRRNPPRKGSAGRAHAHPADVRFLSRAVLLIVFALLVLLAARQVASLDVGFHLKAGEYILSGRGWPANDPFTYTVNDHPYVDTSWGYQVLLVATERIAGAPGLVLLNVLLVLGIFVILCRTARLAPSDPLIVPVLILLGGVASEMRFETRPELVSYLLLALVLHLLHRHAEGRTSPLWTLVPIHLLWANLHGLFVLGWLAEGCFLAGLWLKTRRLDRRLLIWAAASAVVTLLNPYGWRGALFPLLLATRLQPENLFAQSIGEFTSPFDLGLSSQFPFYPRAPVFAFRAFVLLSLLALVAAWRRGRFWCLVLWMAFMALAFRMIRNVPLLVIAALPATAWGLNATALMDRVAGRERRKRLALRAGLALVAIAAILLGLRVHSDAYYVASRRVDRSGLGWNRLALPIEAARYVRRAGVDGPVLNHLNFGGWLMWALPGPVFIDGRLEVMGEEFYAEYRRALGSAEALEAAVRRYGIRWLVFPYSFNPDLLGRVSRDPEWRLLHVDHLAVLFARRDAGAPFDVSPSLPGALPPASSVGGLPGLGGPPRPGRLRRWLSGLARRAEFPSEDYNLGLFHLYRGEHVQAAARFSSAISRSDGAYYEIYNNLGAVLFRMKRYDEARACYEIVLEEVPGNRIARDRLERIDALRRSGAS